MNEVDQISLANQLFHLIIGDTKPNYIAHSVQELNPLILGVMQWAQNQGWSENELAQEFNDNFCSYYTGIVAIRYRCVFTWLKRACNDEDSDAIDRIISHFLYTPDNGLVNYEKIYPLINGDFPIGRFNSGITMNNNAEWLMSVLTMIYRSGQAMFQRQK